MLILRASGIALCTTAVLAQGALVSPQAAANAEGISSNAFPWNSTTPRRYLQLHGDLGSTPRVITALSFRVNAAAQVYVGTRTHDIEVFMGEGVPALQPRFRFDQNYVGPRTLVLPRTTVTFGPQGQSQLPGPSAFTGMDLVLATPFVWSGAHSLVWEVVYHGQVAATGLVGTYSNSDAEMGSITYGTSYVTGAGCSATGRSAAMEHTLTCTDVAGTLLMNATVFAAPAQAPCWLALGLTDPAVMWPGLCGLLRTDAAVVASIGMANAAGAITTDTPAGATFLVPNVLGGMVIKSQVIALDGGWPGPLPVCLSDGRSATVPMPDTTRSPAVSRVFNSTGGTTASEGVFYPSTVGYGLVTRFTYQ